MVKNYIKIAFRNLAKHRMYTSVNIAGLALGMVCCMLILLWVQDELGYDRFHAKGDRLYMCVNQLDADYYTASPWMLAPTLKADFPEIEKYTRFNYQNLLVQYGDRSFYEDVGYADPDFFEIFSFPLIEGDHAKALTTKESAVISEKLAQKLFKGVDPLGRIITINRNTALTVTGVMKNIPLNSSIQCDMIVPIKNYGEDRIATWFWETTAYVLLRENVAVDDVRAKIAGTAKKYDKRVENKPLIDGLQLFSNIHLYGLNGNGGSIQYIYIFSSIALLVLLIACINFINLVTARGSVRAREIGIRKIVGAGKKQIIRQLYGETFLLAAAAFVVALVLVYLVLPGFNALTDKELSLDLIGNPFLLIGSLGVLLMTTFIAGSYPALLLSSFQPLRIIKEKSTTGSGRSTSRRVLVIAQFAASIILIVLTMTMNRQIAYIQNKNLGFNREQVLSLPMNDAFRARYDVMKDRLLQYPGIVQMTAATGSPNAVGTVNPVTWEGRPAGQFEYFNYVSVDYDYFETFEMKMAEGRPFSKEFSTDRGSYIVNQKAVEYMKMKSPIGKIFSIWNQEGKIVGVVKDFHSRSLRSQIVPVVMTLNQYMPLSYAFIRIDPHNVKTTLAFIEKTWKELLPDYPYQYEFLDDMFRRQYVDEEKITTLFQCFSGLAIFISAIGLFGLATFIAQRRTKEIGIRKVVGATIGSIIGFMLKDFVKWIVIAMILAIPISYYVTNKWLENFAYRTDLAWTVFAGAGLLVMLIALLTVGWQAVRAATANPVESLRYE